MPLQTYRCPSHGEFDIRLSFSQDVPQTYPCTGSWCGDEDCLDPCGRASPHVIKPPAGIIVQDGTGAGRGHAQARKESSWNEKASDLRRDPYTQAKAQLEGTARMAAEKGKRPEKIREESIQATAAAIHESNTRPKAGPVHKKIAVADKLRSELRASKTE